MNTYKLLHAHSHVEIVHWYQVKVMVDENEPPQAPDQQSLKDELMGRFSAEKFGLENREVAVMARMNSYIVDVLDALVELEIFKSRSEAVASFVERMVLSQRTTQTW